MRTRILRTAAAGMVACVLVASGCRIPCLHKAKAETVDHGSVTIGGAVYSPQRVPLDESGVSLQRSLAIAGGVRTDLAPAVATPRDLSKLIKSLIEHRDSAQGLLQKIDSLTVESIRMDAVEENKKIAKATNGFANSCDLLVAEVRINLVERLGQEFIGKLNQSVDGVQGHQQKLAQLAVVEKKAEDAQAEAKTMSIAVQGHLKIVDDLEAYARSTNGVMELRNQTIRDSDALAVSLQRTVEGQLIHHYFTLQSVATGLAGSIPLRSGDFVEVVPIGNTPLGIAPASNGGGFNLAGFVEQPGMYPLTSQTLGEILRSHPLPPTIARSAMSVVVTRAGGAAIGTDQYVLPYEDALSAPLAQVRVQADDVVSIVPMFQVPIILETVAESIARETYFEQIRRTPMLNPAQKAHLQIQRCDDELKSGRPVSLPVFSNMWSGPGKAR